MTCRYLPAALAALSLACMAPSASSAKDLPAPEEIRSIAHEALVYGLPIVMGYGVMYDFAIDEKSPNFKAPINHLYNEARTFTSADTGVVTPNSDTPYSFDWMDLRAEPMVICIPETEKERYYSVMLTSLYTYNFGYLGSRTTGNGGGCYAIAGPDWTGDAPDGIDKVITSGSQFAFAVFRTQLFDADDIENVRAIQAKYSVKPLSEFLGTTAPEAAPEVEWPAFESLSKVLGEPRRRHRESQPSRKDPVRRLGRPYRADLWAPPHQRRRRRWRHLRRTSGLGTRLVELDLRTPDAAPAKLQPRGHRPSRRLAAGRLYRHRLAARQRP